MTLRMNSSRARSSNGRPKGGHGWSSLLLRRRRRPPPRRASSLIELMVVIAIMGLLATVVAVNLMGRTYGAKVTKVMGRLRLDEEGHPDVQDRRGLVSRPPRRPLGPSPAARRAGRARYPRERAAGAETTPWGNPYTYQKQGNSKFKPGVARRRRERPAARARTRGPSPRTRSSR